jgi:transcriptional regulator with XRE-family HTH domain
LSTNTLERHRVALAFGVVLRTARKQRGLSQEELGEGAELDRTYASLLERGLRTPTLTVIIELARVLHVEPAQLVSDTIQSLHRTNHDRCSPQMVTRSARVR